MCKFPEQRIEAIVSQHSVHYTNMSQGLIWKCILRVIDICYILSLERFVLVTTELTNWSDDIRIANTITLETTEVGFIL